jgi:hypothetical protein
MCNRAEDRVSWWAWVLPVLFVVAALVVAWAIAVWPEIRGRDDE